MSNGPNRCSVTVGVVVAAGMLFSAHGEDGYAEFLLREVGITSAEKARTIGCDEYDIELLKPVFADLSPQEDHQ